MAEHQEHPAEERMFFFEQQEVIIDDFPSTGHILDIGGGGEGIIGSLKGSQVIAIDPNKEELEEAAAGPIKIVMDARDLQFLDNTFDTLTSFYTLMYVKESGDLSMLFQEAYRVLKPGGIFRIWDVATPPRQDTDKEFFVILLRVILPGEEIETGYGQRWPEQPRDMAYMIRLAQSTGFSVLESHLNNNQYTLILRKND